MDYGEMLVKWYLHKFACIQGSVADPDPNFMFLGLLDPDPDPLDRGMEPDPDPSIFKQK
jgi:hypothetical protein